MKNKTWISETMTVFLAVSLLLCAPGCSPQSGAKQSSSSETMGLKAVTCKQALLPTAGRVISYGNEKINLDFTVIDRYNASELTAFNLKNVRLTDKDGNDLTVEHWYVTTSKSDELHAEKHLHVTVNLPESKKEEIKSLTITYKSGTKKTFDTGALTVESESGEATSNKEIVESELDFITSDKDPSQISGAVMYIPGCKSELEIDSISTGIEGLAADLQNISIIDEYIDLDELKKEIAKEDEWTKIFAKPRQVDEVEEPKDPVIIKKLDPKAYHTILIPFVCTEDYKTENTVNAYTMIISCNDKENDKTYLYVNQPTFFHTPDLDGNTLFTDIFKEFGK